MSTKAHPAINVDQRSLFVRRAGLRTSVRWVIRLAVVCSMRSARASSFTARARIKAPVIPANAAISSGRAQAELGSILVGTSEFKVSYVLMILHRQKAAELIIEAANVLQKEHNG